jgi:hypothetical protein
MKKAIHFFGELLFVTLLCGSHSSFFNPYLIFPSSSSHPFPPSFVIDLHLRRRQPPAPSTWLSLNLLLCVFAVNFHPSHLFPSLSSPPFPPFFVIDLHLQRHQPPALSLWLSLNLLLVGCDLLAALRFCGQLPGQPSLLSPSSIFLVVDFFCFPMSKY